MFITTTRPFRLLAALVSMTATCSTIHRKRIENLVFGLHSPVQIQCCKLVSQESSIWERCWLRLTSKHKAQLAEFSISLHNKIALECVNYCQSLSLFFTFVCRRLCDVNHSELNLFYCNISYRTLFAHQEDCRERRSGFSFQFSHETFTCPRFSCFLFCSRRYP